MNHQRQRFTPMMGQFRSCVSPTHHRCEALTEPSTWSSLKNGHDFVGYINQSVQTMMQSSTATPISSHSLATRSQPKWLTEVLPDGKLLDRIGNEAHFVEQDYSMISKTVISSPGTSFPPANELLNHYIQIVSSVDVNSEAEFAGMNSTIFTKLQAHPERYDGILTWH